MMIQLQSLLDDFNSKIDGTRRKNGLIRSFLTSSIVNAHIQHSICGVDGNIMASTTLDLDDDGLVKIKQTSDHTYETIITLTLKNQYLKKAKIMTCPLLADCDGEGVKINIGEWTYAPVDPYKLSTYLYEYFIKQISELDLEESITK